MSTGGHPQTKDGANSAGGLPGHHQKDPVSSTPAAAADWPALVSGIIQDFHIILMRIISHAKQVEEAGIADQICRKNIHHIMGLTQQGKDLVELLFEYNCRTLGRETTSNTSKLLTGLIAMTKPLLPDHISLRAEIPTGLPSLQIQKMRLEQALFNLLLNALEAIDDEGEIYIKAAEISSEKKLDSPTATPATNGYLRICIADNGCGMTEDVRRQACEPLFTTKSNSESAGLGLAIVSRILSENDGWLYIDSQPGRGTQCDIYVPVALP